MGILAAALTPSGDGVVVGCGDGTVATLKLPNLKIAKYAYSDTEQQLLAEA